MRILVVDDSEDWRDLTEAALMAAGYEEVGTADSAAAAYTQLGLGNGQNGEGGGVDLVVLDVMMPEIDGIEACARIRNDPRYADTPIIMVTAAHDMESLSSAFVAGATDYITKPFNRVELLARTRSALKIKAELDRRRARESELVSLSRSTWGDRDSTRVADESTGLLLGPAAEAYLAAATALDAEEVISVFALAVDRLDALTAACGKNARRDLLSEIAQAVGKIPAPLGVTAGIYPDGVIVLIAPCMPALVAKRLGQELRTLVIQLAIANPEAIAADRATISIGLVTSRQRRTELIADARHLCRDAASSGGNRVLAVDLSSN